MRKKRAELANNRDFVEKVLKEGSEKARTVAIETIKEVKKVTGLVGNIYN
jgi:tryptophanyl-tRNA synthetase